MHVIASKQNGNAKLLAAGYLVWIVVVYWELATVEWECSVWYKSTRNAATTSEFFPAIGV